MSGIDRQPTDAAIRDLLSFNPETGVLWWRSRDGAHMNAPSHFAEQAALMMNARFSGTRAGSTPEPGEYVRVKVMGSLLAAHRIAWFLYYGDWPSGVIDHINGDVTDNRISNLRDCSHHQNMQNKKDRPDLRRSKFRGVSPARSKLKPWQANINSNGRRHYLGCFACEASAALAYAKALVDLHGEFAFRPLTDKGADNDG